MKALITFAQLVLAAVALILILSEPNERCLSTGEWLTVLFWTKFIGATIIWLDVEWYKKWNKSNNN